MSVYITSLNSGSNGNCYYVGNERDAVLVDAGISCRETEKRMQRLGLSMQKVRAIFISHEHSDHIRGLDVLSRKYQIPVYVTPKTKLSSDITFDRDLFIPFNGYEPIQIGELLITGFPKFHDACDPHSFIIQCQKIKIGVFTDIGAPCTHVTQHFAMCNAAFLEANYDETMLEQGRYPYHLKRRIRGGYGHLSNVQALEIFKKYRPGYMSHLLLSHLSKDNNSPELVEQLFNLHAKGTQIVIASRYQETEVFRISNGLNDRESEYSLLPMQYSLF